jgi:hypothetical protein
MKAKQKYPSTITRFDLPKWRMRAAIPQNPSFVPDGWISMREAIEQAGFAKFEREWTGAELTARWLPSLDGQSETTIVSALADAGESLGPEGDGSEPRQHVIVLHPLEDYRAESAGFERHRAVTNSLRQALHSGNLRAVRKLPSGQLESIETHRWASEEMFTAAVRHGHMVLASLDMTGALARASILIDEAGLEAFLKPRSKAKRRNGKMMQPRINAWFRREWGPENQRAGTLPKPEDDLRAARRKFGEGVTRDQVREARRLHAPQSWKTGGRPSRQKPRARPSSNTSKTSQ